MSPVRIATYNVHRGVGADGAYRPERIAGVIGELDADVVALQEVDWHLHPEDSRPQYVYFPVATGMTAIEGPNLVDHRGHYGNVLLTRLPVIEFRRLDLSVPGLEPRGAIVARLGVGARALHVAATHLGRRAWERWRQVGWLLEAVAASDAEATVLLGDFNHWLRIDPTLGRVLAAFGPRRAPRSFPSRRPLLALDRVFVRPRALVSEIEAHASRLARVASDHLPVRATVALP